MKIKHYLLVLFCGIFSLLYAYSAHAAILFQDGLESGNFNNYDFVWNPTNVVINSNPSLAHSGNYSAAIHYYVSSAAPEHNDSNRWFEKDFSPGLNHFFIRGNVYFGDPLSGTESIQRKLFYLKDPSGPQGSPNYYWATVLGSFGYNLTLSAEGNVYWDLYQMQPRQWYCLEMEVTANAPGSSDGSINIWVNDNQVFSRNNMNPRGNYTSGITRFEIGTQVDRIGLFTVDEYRYWDDIAIADSRIGCNNATTTPPSSPPTAPSCTESWTCGDWSACSNGTQTRTCTDANACGTTVNKPSETHSCNDPFIVTGAGPGTTPRVRVFDRNGRMTSDFYAFEKSFKGGIFVATADTNADGTDEIIVGAGSGRRPEVRVFTKSGTRLATFSAYSGTFRGGVHVAGSDINKDGIDEIITGAGSGARPYVRVFRNQSGTYRAIASFDLIAYSSTFKGGVFVAALDSNGDGRDELVTAPGTGGRSNLRIFSSSNNKFTAIQSGLLAYSQTFRGGTFMTGANITGSVSQELITAPASAGRPYVQTFYYQNNRLTLLNSGFLAYSPAFGGGVSVTAADTNLDGIDEIITAVGSGSEPLVRIWSSNGRQILRSFYAFSQSFKGGVTVAAGE